LRNELGALHAARLTIKEDETFLTLEAVFRGVASLAVRYHGEAPITNVVSVQVESLNALIASILGTV